jgi:carboxypeptidase Q
MKDGKIDHGKAKHGKLNVALSAFPLVRFSLFVFPLLFFPLSCARGAQTMPAAAATAARVATDTVGIAFLLEESRLRSKVAGDFRHLTDVIGPRLSGSPAMRRANDWTAARFREYGADSVALEPWPFGVSWTRGPLTVRLVAPYERRIEGASWAWAPGTNGPVAGDVVFMDATTRPDFDRRFAGKLRGAWVMLEAPYPRVNPWGATTRDSARVDSLRRVMRRQRTADERAFLGQLQELLRAQGIAGELIDGAKDYGLFTMSGSPDQVSPFPQIVIGNQSFAELHRSIAAGERVRIEVNATNTFGRDTLPQWNTVAEIRGSERPDEVVLLGAHLDSWDLGTGASDNAAGSIAVLEAARLLGALKASGKRPRRTIRFALFSGEEQGLFGSQYYVLTHAAEMPRFQAVLVLDNGTGRIIGLPLQGQDDLRGMWDSMLAPLASIGPIPVRSGTKGGSDHLPFIAARVPSFNYDQLSRGYDYTHHSQADVFDAAQPADIAQAATVMAVNAWQLANLDRLLPRRR